VIVLSAHGPRSGERGYEAAAFARTRAVSGPFFLFERCIMAEETYRPRCKHLCCKAMLVYGESFTMDPDYQAGLTEFWCSCTTKTLGPDGNGVSLEECSDNQRSCFREY
jgi:hypothetical protein